MSLSVTRLTLVLAGLVVFVAAPATAASQDRDSLVACVVLKSGQFDQHPGGLFFSAIGPVKLVKGMMVGDPVASFKAKVTASYSVSGFPFCQGGDTIAELEVWQQGVAQSYKRHKHVKTGIAPL